MVEPPPLEIKTHFEEHEHGIEGDMLILECELTYPSSRFKIMHNGEDIEQHMEGRVKVLRDGAKIKVILDPAELEDAGFYSIETRNDYSSHCDVQIGEKMAEMTKQFSDLKVNFKDRAEFIAEVMDETTKGVWEKDGKPINIDDPKYKVIEVGRIRKLIIEPLTNADQGEYGFKTEGKDVPMKLSAALEDDPKLFATVAKNRGRESGPKIFLSRTEDKSLTVKAGHNLKLDLPIKDIKNHPCTWFKGEKGDTTHPLDVEGRVAGMCSEMTDRTTLKLSKAVFDDQGLYSVRISKTDDMGQDYFEWFQWMVWVIDVPSPPSKPEIMEVGQDDCDVTWGPPEDDGGCAFRGK